MKFKTRFIKKAIAVLLSFAVVLPSFVGLVGNSGAAEAMASLPYIEQIKADSDVFNILEIVPDASNGSIGYYIPGYEPWLTLAGTHTSRADRKAFVDGTGSYAGSGSLRSYLNKSGTDQNNPQNNYSIELCNPSGVAASEDSYPLSYTGNYQEVYPWESHLGYNEIPLAHEEVVSDIKGIFVAQKNGDYTENNTYSFLPGGTGQYVQVISNFSTTQVPGAYYYNVAFNKIIYNPSSTLAKWTLVYRVADTGETPDLTVNIAGANTKLCVVGIVGTADFPGLDAANTYYTASWGAPSATYNSTTAPYRAIANSYRERESSESGYYSRTTNNFKYVGTGGTYSFTPSSAGNSNTITYSTVYCTGGFTNNNWFLRYVFDWGTGENMPNFKVKTVTPDKVTTSMVDTADLVVINYGLNITGTTYDGIYRNDFSNSTGLLSVSAQAELLAKCAIAAQTDKTPIIFDYNLKDSSQTLINNFADILITNAGMSSKDYDAGDDGVDHVNYASGNQYCINSAQFIKTETVTLPTGDSRTYTTVYFGLALACKGFNDSTLTYGDTTVDTNPFYSVYEDIYYENVLRQIKVDATGTAVDMLDANKIAMATSIRYIINNVKKRTVQNKTVVRVLDIEPRSGSLTAPQKTMLAGWLGVANDSAHLNVTTMSTAEFVGKNNDIRNDYDLVYIGDDLTGFETTTINGTVCTTYTDANMPRLIYSNVGDTVISGFSSGYGLSGLLERDYTTVRSGSTTYNVINNNDSARTFRYSGNDVSSTAADKLKAFADSGCPVIVGDKLVRNELLPSGSSSNGIAYVTSSKIDWDLWQLLFNFFDYIIKLINYCIDSAQYTPSGSTDVNLLFKVNLTRVAFGDFPWWFGGRVRTAESTLYRNGSPVSGSTKILSGTNTVNFDLSDYGDGDTFYSQINVTGITDAFGAAHNGDITNSSLGRTATYTLHKGANPTYVDSNSYMFNLLNEICTRKNVKTWTAVNNSTLNKSLIKKLVNLSTPQIEFLKSSTGDYMEYPTPYKLEGGTMTALAPTDGANRLQYAFTIRNDSDPFPLTTHYSCNLYIDMNGNGSFSEDEKVTDAGILKWDNGLLGSRVTNGQMVAGEKYYLYFDLPSSKTGLVPWKLEIVDTSYTSYNCVIDYTRVKPVSVPTIKVLQIKPNTTCTVDLSTNADIKALLNAVNTDFKVNVTAVTINQAKSISTTALKHADGDGDTTSYTDLRTYLNSFNMLVLGFGDNYGDLDFNTTKIIKQYIVDDKGPVLISHDVASYFYLPSADYGLKKNSSSYSSVYGTNSAATNGWSGYYVNMLLRNAIGMDRYGITDSTYGYTSKTPSTVGGTSSHVVANGYNGVNPSNIESAGFDVAYQAKYYTSVSDIPSTKATVAETQGLTNGILARFKVSGKMPFYSAAFSTNDSANKAGFTNTVSQVNKGQITIYPYNINTTSFGGTEGTNDYIHIGLTHLQYFQLNMDKPDMTVWYCIDDPAFSTKADTTDNTEYMGSNIYPKNDVVNDYYIYTCGNVTYTGMGHTSKISASEEKLLVNTLIASYRVTEVPPTVSFSNKNGTQRGIESFFIPYDGNDYLSPTVAAESRRIYFTVNDSNVIKNKVILPVLKIGGTQVDLPIYDANTDTQVDFTKPGASLTSTYTYYVKLEDVLTIIKSSSLTIGSNGLDFTVKVTTTLPSGNAPPGYASLSLRRLTLFTLN